MNRIGYLYSNEWQKKLYSRIFQGKEELLVPIRIYDDEHCGYDLKRSITCFTKFSLIDSIINYYFIYKQIKDIQKKIEIKAIIIDNPDRYIERIFLRLIQKKNIKIIVLQHGFDPLEATFERSKTLSFKLSAFVRNLIFSGKISTNCLYHIDSNKTLFISYSEYFKTKIKKYTSSLNIRAFKDLRLSAEYLDNIVNDENFAQDDILVYTGIFRYKKFRKEFKHLINYLEDSMFINIYLKPKLGETETIEQELARNKLTKNYILLREDLLMENLLGFKNVLCSIESTLSLIYSKGYLSESLYFYDIPYSEHSIIKSFMLNQTIKVNNIIYRFKPTESSNKKLNFLFGFDLKPITKEEILKFSKA